MLGDVNFNLENIKYRLFLCNPQKEAIAELHEAYNVNYFPRFMDIGELSFTIPYKIDNVKNNNWDLIKGEFLILLNDGTDDLGYFIIEEPTDNGSDIQVKTLRCFSSEFNLSQKRLRSYTVDSISLNDLMNETTNPSGEKPRGILPKEAPSWTFVPTTDVEITAKFRSFDIADSSLWDFIITEVASSYGCVFLFNTLTNTITAELLENVGENKGLVVSKDNFINSIQASMKFSDIITKLVVQGKDNTIINEYNILGTMYLLNYDNYRNTDYMSESLRDALTAWYIKIDNNRAQFDIYLDDLNNPTTGYRKQLSDKQDEIVVLKTELKIIEENIRIGLTGNPYPEGKTYTQWRSERSGKISQIETAIGEQNTISDNIDSTLIDMSTLSNTLSVSDLSNFTEAQQKELDYFTKTDVYSNPYILDSEELIDDAAEFFDRVNIPRTKFDIDSVDFLNITEYQKDHNKLNIGDIINIEYNDFNIDYVQVRLTGYDHDAESNTLRLMFSNQNRYDDPYVEFIDGSYKAYNAGVTLDIERYKYNDFVNNNKETLITFTESPIDVDVNSIETDDGMVLDESGTYSRDEENALNQMRMLYDRIIYTNDNWATEPYPMLSADGLQVIDSNRTIKIVAQVSDELVEDSYAEKGFIIYRNIGSYETPIWEAVFYADENGDLVLEGSVKLNSGELVIDQYGIDPKYIKFFKNMVYNSSFELFSPINNNQPTYWSGGYSDPDSFFSGSHSMRLDTTYTTSQTTKTINPEWYDDIANNTRVSFYHKGGSVKVEILDQDGNLINNLYQGDTLIGDSITFDPNVNWNIDRNTFWFPHGDGYDVFYTDVKIKFSYVDATVYIDAVQLEPDFTGQWSSFYTDGGGSIPSNPNGGTGLELYIQNTDPSLTNTLGFGALWIDTDDQADELDFFTVADRTKLDAISPEANKVEESATNGNILIDTVETNVYTHPVDAGNKHIPSGGATDQILVYDSDGTAVWTNTTDNIHGNLSGGSLHDVATPLINGFMSSTDKDKLDDIDFNANNYVHPATHPADMIIVDDAGYYYTSENVEGVLQEIGSQLDGIDVDKTIYVADWDSTVEYMTGDACYYGGKFYKSTLDNNIDNQPDTSNWEEITGEGVELPVIEYGDAGKFLAVNSTEDGYEWKNTEEVTEVEWTNVQNKPDLYTQTEINTFLDAKQDNLPDIEYGDNGKVLKANESTSEFELSELTELDIIDLDKYSQSEINTLLDAKQDNLPNIEYGDAGKSLVINSSEDGYEYTDLLAENVGIIDTGGYFDYAIDVEDALQEIGLELNDIEEKSEMYKTYAGFLDRTSSEISIDSGTGVFTIDVKAPATEYTIYVDGNKHIISSSKSITVTDDQTLTYIYFDSNGNLQKSTTIWDLESGDNIPCAIVFKDGSEYAPTDERHGHERNKAWHKWAHFNIGAMYRSGFVGTFEDETLSVTHGVVYDEDIVFNSADFVPPLSSPMTTCTLWYRNATDGMRIIRNSTTPYRYDTVLKYDDGTVNLADVTNNRYSTQWVYATNDSTSPIYVVIGQNNDNTISDARNATAPIINLSTAEWKLIYRVIYQRKGTDVDHVETADFRNIQTGVPVSPFAPNSHTSLINRDASDSHPASAISTDTTNFDGKLSVIDDTVQKSLDTLDNHNHIESEITDLDKYTQTEVNNLLNNKQDSLPNIEYGDSGKSIVVNALEDGYEHKDLTESDITDLDKYTQSEMNILIDAKQDSLPEIQYGDSGKFLAVNNTEDGYEYKLPEEVTEIDWVNITNNPIPDIEYGDSGKAIVANATEDGFELTGIPTLITKYNLTLSSASWVNDTINSGYWKYTVSDTDVDSNSIVGIYIHLSDYSKTEGLLDITESANNEYYIYSENDITDNISYDVKISKGAV